MLGLVFLNPVPRRHESPESAEIVPDKENRASTTILAAFPADSRDGITATWSGIVGGGEGYPPEVVRWP